MWSWSGGNSFLLALLLLAAMLSAVSAWRFVRRRQHWPLSSPEATRHPAILCTTVALLVAWAALHVARQMAAEQMPCALYVFATGIILQTLCVLFEVRLYSLLFLFECTQNLCNMNEHRKQKAALLNVYEQEKKDTGVAIGLQLQSPPHSLVRPSPQTNGNANAKGAALTEQHLLDAHPPLAHEAAAAGGPDAPNGDLVHHQPQDDAELETQCVLDGLEVDPLARSRQPAVESWVAQRQRNGGAVAGAVISDSPFTNSRRITPVRSGHALAAGTSAAASAGAGAGGAAVPPNNLFRGGSGSGRRLASGASDANNDDPPAVRFHLDKEEERKQQQHRGDPATAAAAAAVSPSAGVAASPSPTHNGHAAAQPSGNSITDTAAAAAAGGAGAARAGKHGAGPVAVGSNRDHKRGGSGGGGKKVGDAASEGSQGSSAKGAPLVRRSYLLPNWFVLHRRYIRPPFQVKWLLFWNGLQAALLVVLLLAQERSDSHLWHNTRALNNLRCNVAHVAGLQLVWCMVGLHAMFMGAGLWRLWARFPMDGFQVKKELYALAALAVPAVALHLFLPDSLEAQLRHYAAGESFPPDVLSDGLLVSVDSGGGSTYFVRAGSSAASFAVDCLFSILLPLVTTLLLSESVIARIEPTDSTTALLAQDEIVSTLEELLATKHGFASFFNFLKTEFTMQNLLYWRACKNFHVAIDDHRYLCRNIIDSQTRGAGAAAGGMELTPAGGGALGAALRGGRDFDGGNYVAGYGMPLGRDDRAGAAAAAGAAMHRAFGAGDRAGGGGGGAGGVLSALSSGGGGGLMSDLGGGGGGSIVGRHTLLGPQHRSGQSPRNSVLSLSIGNVGLKVGPPRQAFPHPSLLAANGATPASPAAHPGLGGVGGRSLRIGGGTLENAQNLPHPPANAHLPPGAISPSHTSHMPGGTGYARGSTRHTLMLQAQEGSMISLGGAVLQVGSTIGAPGGGGGGAGMGFAAGGAGGHLGGGGGAGGGGGGGGGGGQQHIFLPGQGPTVSMLLGGGPTIDPDAAPNAEIARLEAANPALRAARLHKQAMALAVEHTRLHAMKLLEKARSIYERFVRRGAPYEVTSVDPSLRQSIVEFMGLLNAGFKSPVDQVDDIGKIFTDSQECVYTLMQTDAFPRYLSSRYFAEFKSNARARAALQQVRLQRVTMERVKRQRQEEEAAAAAMAAANLHLGHHHHHHSHHHHAASGQGQTPALSRAGSAPDPALASGPRHGLGFGRVPSGGNVGPRNPAHISGGVGGGLQHYGRHMPGQLQLPHASHHGAHGGGGIGGGGGGGGGNPHDRGHGVTSQTSGYEAGQMASAGGSPVLSGMRSANSAGLTHGGELEELMPLSPRSRAPSPQPPLVSHSPAQPMASALLQPSRLWLGEPSGPGGGSGPGYGHRHNLSNALSVSGKSPASASRSSGGDGSGGGGGGSGGDHKKHPSLGGSVTVALGRDAATSLSPAGSRAQSPGASAMSSRASVASVPRKLEVMVPVRAGTVSSLSGSASSKSVSAAQPTIELAATASFSPLQPAVQQQQQPHQQQQQSHPSSQPEMPDFSTTGSPPLRPSNLSLSDPLPAAPHALPLGSGLGQSVLSQINPGNRHSGGERDRRPKAEAEAEAEAEADAEVEAEGDPERGPSASYFSSNLVPARPFGVDRDRDGGAEGGAASSTQLHSLTHTSSHCGTPSRLGHQSDFLRRARPTLLRTGTMHGSEVSEEPDEMDRDHLGASNSKSNLRGPSSLSVSRTASTDRPLPTDVMSAVRNRNNAAAGLGGDDAATPTAVARKEANAKLTPAQAV